MALRQKSALKSAVVSVDKRSSVDNPGGIRGGRNRTSSKGSDTSITRLSKTEFGKSRGKRPATSPICLVDSEILNSAIRTPAIKTTAIKNTAIKNSELSDAGKVSNSAELGRSLDAMPPRLSQSTPDLKAVKHPTVEAPKEDSSNSPDQNMIQRVESAIHGLGKLESDVMAALFPTDGSLPQSNEVIAQRLGMTVEEVKGVADNALRGLRGARGPGGRGSSVWN